ncbi:MAG TPA: hypothetical protein VGK31_04895 [Thermoanaerobaculia bacterium]|jgi:hypothetical protein
MRRVVAAALFLAIAIASRTPIRSPDAFWHLATGRWIAEHHAVPLYDPFAVASAHIPWINGEWLYEVALYCVWAIGGLAAIPWAHAAFVGLIFTIAFVFALREKDVSVAALLTAIAFACIAVRMVVRPSTVAALFVVLAIAILEERPGRTIATSALYYTLLTILWINVHPSALLAPIIAAATIYLDRRRWILAAASAAALLVNPYGVRGITAPLELMSMQREGGFVNTEWLPSPPQLFPFLYLAFIGGVLAFALVKDKRPWAWRAAIFAVLFVLAAAHVRNQTLFFPALPLLVPWNRRGRLSPTVMGVTTAAIVALPLFSLPHAGVSVHFPVRAVLRLKASGLPGTIYTADQFGGFLIWNFYGQRRVTTDGRNELFRQYIAEDEAAHRDSRARADLFRKYHVAIAVDEYSPPINVIDPRSRRSQRLPASLVWYPRREWALIAYDDLAMVFARRSAFPPDVIRRFEYPDSIIPEQVAGTR